MTEPIPVEEALTISQFQRALKQVVESADRVALDPIIAYRLESIGLVKLRGDRAIPSCELYRQYFGNFLAIA
ncbi:MAG: AAA-like domain-containing protein [Cyanobacteria bacterium SBLK]|nr:AAA-like domain-containing protein [Cyanobacteria bacterium SBLK]